MAETPDTPTRPPVRRTTTRLSRETIWIVAGLLCGILLLYTFVTLSQRRKQAAKPVAAPKPSLYEVSGEARADARLRTQAKYAGWNREEPPPPPSTDPIPPAATPQLGSLLPTPQPLQPPGALPPPSPAPRTPPPRMASPPPPRQAPPVAEQRQPTPAPKKWLAAQDKATVEAPPFPLPTDAEGQGRSRGSRLFPQAVWEQPAHPERVLFADFHVIHGQLLQNINTDVPSPIRILVTQDVEDRFGQGHILIPQGSTLLTEPTGKANYGQARIPITLKQGSFPNGTAIQFPKATVGDQQGAAGVPASVDHHLLSTVAGVGLSAILSIGARAPFGSAGLGQFQPSLEQEFARDVSQDLNRAGQKLIDREFQRSPTLRAAYGAPVTITLNENISFMTNPVKVSR
jgi:type IV secretory pathway VirB10-like protein